MNRHHLINDIGDYTTMVNIIYDILMEHNEDENLCSFSITLNYCLEGIQIEFSLEKIDPKLFKHLKRYFSTFKYPPQIQKTSNHDFLIEL